MVKEEDGVYTYRLSFKIKGKTNANVTVTKPKAGEAPVFEATTDTTGVEVVGKAHWFLGDIELNALNTFEAGKTYTLKVALKGDADHAVSEDSEVLINGEKAKFVSKEADTLIFSLDYKVTKEDDSS